MKQLRDKQGKLDPIRIVLGLVGVVFVGRKDTKNQPRTQNFKRKEEMKWTKIFIDH